MAGATPREPTPRWAHLPEPVRLEDTVTSEESLAYPPDKDDYWREVEWMLRVTGAG